MSGSIPDPEIGLRDAADFILNSPLGRRALLNTQHQGLSVFLRDLIEAIYRLSVSCHLPEFTDHGLPHLCNLVDRICQWTCAPNNGETPSLVSLLHDEEPAILLIATLIHDIGMLSQKAEDLAEDNSMRFAKGQMNVADWVRCTHGQRIERLVKRLMNLNPNNEMILSSDMFSSAVKVGEAHQAWPWQEGFQKLENREPGLAAVVAVADLLDEDSGRCDTATLIGHREGSALNKAHWLRHTLTKGRVLVRDGEVFVQLLRPPGTDSQLKPFYHALRNHYRLIQLYTQPLGILGAGFLNTCFEPKDGCPREESEYLASWFEVPGFATQSALLYQLLQTFFAESLLDENRLTDEKRKELLAMDFEEVDLVAQRRINGQHDIRSPYEQEFYALLDESEVEHG